jgi:outer membrane protein
MSRKENTGSKVCSFRFLYQQFRMTIKEMFIVKMRGMEKIWFTGVLVVVFSLVHIGSGFAAGDGDTIKIGTMSLPEILSMSTAGQEAKSKLENKIAEFQAKIQQEQEKQDALRAEVEKKSSIWSEDVKQEKERELVKKGQELKQMKDDAQFELQKMEKNLMAPILRELHQVIAEVGKEHGFTLIFENTNKGLDNRYGLLYSDESLDISEMVREALEKRLAAKKDAK